MSEKLIKAVQNGDYAAALKLLDGGADAGYRDKDGHTGVHWAAAIGHVNILKLLIERGCEVNTANIRGYTPLMAACAVGLRPSVAVLLENGANVNARDEDGATALMCAAGRQEDPLLLRALLTHAAKVNDRSDLGGTALITAARCGWPDNVEVLLEYGADPDASMNDGRTALSAAQEDNHWEIIEMLKRASYYSSRTEQA